MTTAERKIARYRRKIDGRIVKTIVMVGAPPKTSDEFWPVSTLDIFPGGKYTLNGTPILKSELPAWAKKYVT